MILIPHSLLYYLVMRYLCTAGLRKRIATLFFQYCKTPLFNAEAAKHIKVRYIQQTCILLHGNVLPGISRSTKVWCINYYYR